MSRNSLPEPEATRCAFAWCTTPHGRTVHPADEDHRSAGIALPVRSRGAGADGRGDTTEWEVGLLRRGSDDETWLVIEAGRGGSLALPIEGVRALSAVLRNDAELRAWFDDEGSGR